MTQYFPIVVERERSGAFSAWVAAFPASMQRQIPQLAPSEPSVVHWRHTWIRCANSDRKRTRRQTSLSSDARPMRHSQTVMSLSEWLRCSRVAQVGRRPSLLA